LAQEVENIAAINTLSKQPRRPSWVRFGLLRPTLETSEAEGEAGLQAEKADIAGLRSAFRGRADVLTHPSEQSRIARVGHAILSKDYLKRIFLLCCGDNTILVWFNPPIPKTF
jgi:hypothetical protein